MSTKIYDGLIATDTNPFRVMKRLRAVLEPAFERSFLAAVRHAQASADDGKTWAEAFGLPTYRDRYAEWQGPIESKSPTDLAEKVYDLMTLLKADPLHTFSDLDIAYDAIILPNGRGITKEPLVLVFSESLGRDLREAIVREGVVRQYGYWNNTDGPDDLTDAEWEERRLAWDKLDVPARDGMSLGMPSRFDMWRAVIREWEGKTDVAAR